MKKYGHKNAITHILFYQKLYNSVLLFTLIAYKCFPFAKREKGLYHKGSIRKV